MTWPSLRDTRPRSEAGTGGFFPQSCSCEPDGGPEGCVTWSACAEGRPWPNKPLAAPTSGSPRAVPLEGPRCRGCQDPQGRVLRCGPASRLLSGLWILPWKGHPAGGTATVARGEPWPPVTTATWPEVLVTDKHEEVHSRVYRGVSARPLPVPVHTQRGPRPRARVPQGSSAVSGAPAHGPRDPSCLPDVGSGSVLSEHPFPWVHSAQPGLPGAGSGVPVCVCAGRP